MIYGILLNSGVRGSLGTVTLFEDSDIFEGLGCGASRVGVFTGNPTSENFKVEQRFITALARQLRPVNMSISKPAETILA